MIFLCFVFFFVVFWVSEIVICNMGRWSERSVESKPLVKLSTRLLTKMLSI